MTRYSYTATPAPSPKERTMAIRSPLSQWAAFSRALDLYDELYLALREIDADDLFADTYSQGRASIAALRDSSTDISLSFDTNDLLEDYLEGPDRTDADALAVWMRMLPELLVDLRREEDARRNPVVGAAIPTVAWSQFERLVIGADTWREWSDVLAATYDQWVAGEFTASGRFSVDSELNREHEFEPDTNYAKAA